MGNPHRPASAGVLAQVDDRPLRARRFRNACPYRGSRRLADPSSLGVGFHSKPAAHLNSGNPGEKGNSTAASPGEHQIGVYAMVAGVLMLVATWQLSHSPTGRGTGRPAVAGI
jgi:hypothetical protein